jgi:hypothetical protein
MSIKHYWGLLDQCAGVFEVIDLVIDPARE